MVTEVTKGIKVSVVTEYQEDYSRFDQMHHVFAYKIRIENTSPYTIQLQTRHWHIFDLNGGVKEVSGEGVLGLKPVIESGDFHCYVSGCSLKSSIGKMHGIYSFERLEDGVMFEVSIPEFQLMAPHRLN